MSFVRLMGFVRYLLEMLAIIVSGFILTIIVVTVDWELLAPLLVLLVVLIILIYLLQLCDL